MRTYAAARDANEGQIVKALRRVGARVTLISAPGVPDLFVTYHGGHWLEVKDPAKPPSERRLTPAQKAFHALHEVSVVLTPEDALRAIGVGRVVPVVGVVCVKCGEKGNP